MEIVKKKAKIKKIAKIVKTILEIVLICIKIYLLFKKQVACSCSEKPTFDRTLKIYAIFTQNRWKSTIKYVRYCENEKNVV